MPNTLRGGGRVNLSSFTFQSFIDGSLQASVERHIGNYIPFKASAMLGNAAIQRDCILLSSKLFNYECLPTYFGSDYIFLLRHDALMRFPERKSSVALQAASDFAAGLKKIAHAHPTVNFTVYLADMSEFSPCNPARSLISYPTVTSTDFEAILQSELEDMANVIVLGHPFDNTFAYFDQYYRSDHHWSGYGTLAAYDQIAKALNLNRSVASTRCNSQLEGLVMNGSSARSGLVLLNCAIKEPVFFSESLCAEKGDTPPVTQNDGRKILDLTPLHSEFDFYHSWYGPSASISIVNNNPLNPNHREKGLLIGDSYTSSMQWLIAQNYQNCEVRLDCHGGFNGPERLTDLITDQKCEDVYFVMAPTGMTNLANCYPHYFED